MMNSPPQNQSCAPVTASLLPPGHDYSDAVDPSSPKLAAIQLAIRKGLISEEQPVALLLNTSEVERQVAALRAAFPEAGAGPRFVHTFAAKANPAACVLRLMAAHGLGCEAASAGELQAALRAGFPRARVVFDSPVKSAAELRAALAAGVRLNADNLQELAVLAALVARLPPAARARLRLGLRVNPVVGPGAIAAMSTATASSKFGVPVPARQAGAPVQLPAALLEAFRAHPWLSMLHVHVGSQGCGLELAARGVAHALELARLLNRALGRRQVRVLDIGGGLPVDFAREDAPPLFAAYAAALRAHAPALFGEHEQAEQTEAERELGRLDEVLTEFGRALVARAGCVAARVEYVKRAADGRLLALTHAGADLCVRTVYMPAAWPIRVSVLDGAGRPRRGEREAVDVAGPCCFAGDVVAHARPLPPPQPGDWMLLHDTGGYYHAAYSRYNVRQAPPLLLYREPVRRLHRLLRGERVHDSLRFFGFPRGPTRPAPPLPRDLRPKL